MQCAVLAGGLATRMKHLTEHMPKSMLSMDEHPFIYYQLQWLRKQGITEVVLCIGHLGKVIREYVQDGSRWDLRAVYVDEGSLLSGTGGALRKALDSGVLQNEFFVMYGDSFLPIDFQPIWRSFCKQTLKKALMVIYPN